MRQSSALVFAALTGGAVVLGIVGLVARPRRQNPVAPVEAASTEQMKRRFEELEQEVFLLKQERATRAISMHEGAGTKAVTPPAPAADTAPRPERQPELSAEEQEERGKARFAALDVAFRAEARESGWARKTEAALLQMTQRPGLENVVLTNASCGSTLCKVEASAKEASGEVSIDSIIDALPNDEIGGGTFQRLGEPKGNRVVAYFSRKGHDLPAAAP